MRMSQTQIEALRQLLRDPDTHIQASTMKALKHRGLVDDAGALTHLARFAANELKSQPIRKVETRIHLENEPATLSQLRVVGKYLPSPPTDLTKEDASTLIGFFLDKNGRTDQNQRISTIAKLLDVGVQAVDAIAFSSPGPWKTASGGTAISFIASYQTRRKKPCITPALRTEPGAVIKSKAIVLRRRGDVQVTTSNADEIFSTLAQTI